MLVLIRDTLVAEPGYLRLFFERDWTPISFRDSSEAVRRQNYGLDHVSYGHDVETAYLMLEAAHALGLDPAPTLAVGKQMVDHALASGWDDARGGLYNGGFYIEADSLPVIVNDGKTWWAQAEMLNALLLMADLYPDDDHRYYERFETMWTYIQQFLVDAEHGGWYQGGLDQQPNVKDAPKGSIWKGAYHDGRALMNVARLLTE
jgi:mannobiose 2-epimerase